MRDRIVWGLMRLLARLAYGYWPSSIQIFRKLTPEDVAAVERAAADMVAKVATELRAQPRRYRMGVVDDTLDTDLPAITSTPIRGDK